MSASQANWKNVNNWHWTEKNCNKWARKYFDENLVGIQVEYGDMSLKTTRVAEVEGDVDLNQRKGRIITIFDLALTLRWSAELSDGSEVEGSVHIPEMMHDTAPGDLVFDIKVESSTPQSPEEVYTAVKAVLTKAISAKLSHFSGDLIEAHKKDIYIETPDNQSALDVSPALTRNGVDRQWTSPSVAGVETPSSASSAVSIEESVEFLCSASELYDVLLDAQKVSIWSRSPAKISKESGQEFSLFGGNVLGKNTELVEGRRIVQQWRLKNWPKDYSSTVTMELRQSDNVTILHLSQTGVPSTERDVTMQNWKQFYWNPIKSIFGYGLVM